MFKSIRTRMAVLSLALVLSACGSDGTSSIVGDPLAIASITLPTSPVDVMTSAGDSRAIAAVVRDRRGSVMAEPNLVWSSSSPAVATVSGTSGTAIVTSVEDGTATITAASGAVRSSIVVTVHRTLSTVVLTAPDSVLVWGKSAQLTATALDARQHPFPITTGFVYSTSNNRITTITQSGVVTAYFQLVQLPNAVLTATLTRDGVTASGTTALRAGPPSAWEFAALMLTDYVVPARVPAPGAGVVTLTRNGAGFDYLIAWSALSGEPTGVRIRGPAEPTDIAGDVLIALGNLPPFTKDGVTTGRLTGANILPQGERPPITIDSLAALLRAEKVYMEVHTATYQGGEIRGQLLNRP